MIFWVLIVINPGVSFTKLDVLDEQKEIKICIAYKYKGKIIKEFPADIEVLSGCKPVYETMAGWMEETTSCKRYKDLPLKARRYLERLSKLMGTKISIVSVGSRREETIIRK